MPMTVMRGSRSSTWRVYSSAWKGFKMPLVTPGRDSFTQSYFLLQ